MKILFLALRMAIEDLIEIVEIVIKQQKQKQYVRNNLKIEMLIMFFFFNRQKR